jgi:urea transport system ATP-binding protein
MKTDLILDVEGVNKTFDGFKAISNLTFSLQCGEMRVVIGPNGAGKSTFFDLLTGRIKPDSGKIEYRGGTDLTALNEYQINRIGIGRKFQTPSIYVEHTVFDNILLSIKGKRGVAASIFHRANTGVNARIDELLELVRLGTKRHQLAGELAHGEKQWLEIGMLLAQDPQVLLLDEPAAGMADEETCRTGDLLISLAGKHSLVVVEHDMAFVRQIARQNKITVLHQGTVLCEARFDEVQANPKVREVYLGRGK